MGNNTKAYIALFNVCFFWGTTYLALRIGVEHFPAFLFSGIRQFSAGVLLFAGMALFGKLEKLTWKDFARQALPGIFLITISNSTIGWAEKYIPSGLAALIVCIMPLYIVIINLILGKERNLLNKKVIAGFALGCIGIVLIFRDNLSDLGNPDYFWGIIASFIACMFWAIGSVYLKNSKFDTSPFSNAAMQFTIGGLGCFLVSLFVDDYSELAYADANSIWALVYLTLIGSLLAYGSYVYAIKHLPMLVVSTYAYVNPVIAILLGVLILDEKITWITVGALLVTLLGVYLINAGVAKSSAKT
ncbi:EamA domain-containing protein [Flavobacterium longum]|uniref:EamA family transporter n=1 Tax=Flavobacterium longum TaxID=1299340 RepID=UPI0039E8347D